jgi:hypothetical protein
LWFGKAVTLQPAHCRDKDAEKALGMALLAHSGHESGGKAKVLTPAAEELLAWYTRWKKK